METALAEAGLRRRRDQPQSHGGRLLDRHCALLPVQMSFTAYAQVRLPQLAEAFTHFGFPACFRVKLTWAKFLASPAA